MWATCTVFPKTLNASAILPIYSPWLWHREEMSNKLHSWRNRQWELVRNIVTVLRADVWHSGIVPRISCTLYPCMYILCYIVSCNTVPIYWAATFNIWHLNIYNWICITVWEAEDVPLSDYSQTWLSSSRYTETCLLGIQKTSLHTYTACSQVSWKDSFTTQ